MGMPAASAASSAPSAASPAVEITVVLPCRNGAGTIAGQLEALAAQEWDGSWEVVVSDNGSTDGTAGVVAGFRGRLPGLRVIDSSARAGVAYARNAGVAAARGRSVLLCDDDDVVAPGWLAAMAAALRRHDFVAATLELATLNPVWTRDARQAPGLRQLEPPFLPYAFGASLGFRVTRHQAIGGFDESFVGGADDIDYCFRMQLDGAALHLVQDAVTHYRIRSDLRSVYRQGRAYSRGDVRLYAKYRSRGMRWAPLRRAVKFWVLVLPRLVPALRSRTALAGWLWRLGRRVGFLEGSLRHRLLAL